MKRCQTLPLRVLTRRITITAQISKRGLATAVRLPHLLHIIDHIRLTLRNLYLQPSKAYLKPTHNPTAPPSVTAEATVARFKEYMLPVYDRPNFVLSHGKGSYLWDTDGNKYLDFSAGIAVNALGHADEGVVKVSYYSLFLFPFLQFGFWGLVLFSGTRFRYFYVAFGLEKGFGSRVVPLVSSHLWGLLLLSVRAGNHAGIRRIALRPSGIPYGAFLDYSLDCSNVCNAIGAQPCRHLFPYDRDILSYVQDGLHFVGNNLPIDDIHPWCSMIHPFPFVATVFKYR